MIIGGKVTNPGAMNTRITVRNRINGKDSGGFPLPGTTKAYLIRAEWMPIFGSEVWSTGFQGVVEPANVRIRYKPDIDETWEVMKDGKLFEIVGIEDVHDRHEYLMLKVKRVKAG